MTACRTRRAGARAARLVIALCALATPASAQRKPKPAKPKPPPPTAPPHTPAPAPTPPPRAHAPTRVTVSVTEVAGSHAYLQPGSSGGVRRTAKVVIRNKEYVVTDATASWAVIDVGKDPPHENDKGQATIVSEEEDKPFELVKPRSLATWEHAWPQAVAPASRQSPRFVPLGGVERDRRWDVRLLLAGGAVAPLGRGAAFSRVELNARVHGEPFAAPLSLDLDVSLQRWFAASLDAREGGDARPLLRLREALVGYGSGGWHAGFGRMRYAASTLGTLDGTRVRAPLGAGLFVGAFGGVLPHPLSGAPSLSAQRFGVETTYSRPDFALRPEAALVLHGSTFDGGLDERRASGVVGLFPGRSRFGGHFEVSSFDANNPWGASPVEVTAGGLDASIRAGVFQFGGRFDVRQPIRSRWLASFLPTWWFCRTTPAAGAPAGAPEVCDGSVSTRWLGAVDAGVEVDRVAFTVGGTRVGDLTQTGGAPDMTGAFASGRVVRIARVLRLEASGSFSRATYLDMVGGTAGPGFSLFGELLDMSAYYRRAALQYRAIDASLTQHGFGTTVMLLPSPELLFAAQGEATSGDDVNALMVFGTAMWRPRF